MCIGNHSTFAASLSQNISEWEKIGTVKEVLCWIKEGVKLPFSTEPESCRLQNRNLSKQQSDFVSQEIKKLLCTGAIERCSSKPRCVSPIGCVPKKGGKLRMITDLRKINEYCVAPKFSSEDIGIVPTLVKSKDVCVTLDLKDGFHHISIHPDYRQYLGIQ